MSARAIGEVARLRFATAQQGCGSPRRSSERRRVSEYLRQTFLEDLQPLGQALFLGQPAQPARRLVHVLKRKPEGAIVHRHQPARAQILEDSDCLVRPHVDVAEGFRMVSSNGQQRNFRPTTLADLLKSVKIGAVAGMLEAPAL